MNSTLLLDTIPNCDVVSKFDPLTQEYLSLPTDFRYTVFDLVVGDVCFVHVTAPTDFTQYGEHELITFNGSLYYDPSGLNYDPSLNARVGEGFLYPIGRHTRGVTPIRAAVNADTPVVINGTFQVLTFNGVNYVYNYTPSDKRNITDPMDLITNPSLFGFQNIEIEINAVGVPIFNHTYGVATTESYDPSIVFVYLGKTTFFFNDVRIKGVYIPVKNFTQMGIFNIDVVSENQTFATIVPDLALNHINTSIYFILAYNVTFVTNETIINGDVIDVFPAEDLATAGLALIDYDLNSMGFQYIRNMCSLINMEIFVLMDENSTNSSIDFWFVMAKKELSKDKLTGIVKLGIYESNLTRIWNALGIDFNSSYPSKIHVNLGVCIDDNPLSNSSYTYVSIEDLWGMHKETVEVDSFAIGTNLSTITKNIAKALGEEDNVELNYLENFSAFRDPGFCVLIDQNFFNAYTQDAKNWTKQFGFAFLPDYRDGTDVVHVLNLKGVVYNLSVLFPEIAYDIPLIIPDNYRSGNLTYPEVTLRDLYNNPGEYISNGFTAGIKTEGWVTGTTMKTVADYASIVIPQLEVVKYSPIDVGVYDVNYFGGDGNYYHTALVMLDLPTGETYLARPFKIWGIYVDLSNASDWLMQSSDFCNFTDVSSLLGDLNDNFTVNTGNIKMLDGFIIGLKLIDDPKPANMSISRLHVPDRVYGGGNTTIQVYCDVINNGSPSDAFLPNMRFFITSPSGKVITMNTYSLISTPYFTLNMSAESPSLTLEEGTYTVDAYLMGYSGFSSKTLAHARTTFDVRDMTDPFSRAEYVTDGTMKTRTLNQSESYFYKVHLNESDVLMVKLTPHTGADFDIYLYENSTDVVELDSSTNEGSAPEELCWKAENNGDFYIEVYGENGSGDYEILFTKTRFVNKQITPSDGIVDQTPVVYYDADKDHYIVSYNAINYYLRVKEYYSSWEVVPNSNKTLVGDYPFAGYWKPFYPSITKYNGDYYVFYEQYYSLGLHYDVRARKFDSNWVQDTSFDNDDIYHEVRITPTSVNAIGHRLSRIC